MEVAGEWKLCAKDDDVEDLGVFLVAFDIYIYMEAYFCIAIPYRYLGDDLGACTSSHQ